MQALIKPLLTYLVYPLAKNLGEWIYQKYIENKADSKREQYRKERTALKRALKNAKTDEDIKHLSTVLHKLSSL